MRMDSGIHCLSFHLIIAFVELWSGNPARIGVVVADRDFYYSKAKSPANAYLLLKGGAIRGARFVR